MCGMAGSFSDPGFDVSGAVEALRHRGPDSQAIASSGPAVHGHARLSLLDLSPASDQPFRRGDGLLSFVGEIWNYSDVREELAGLGHEFHTTGDTEVLAAALEEWGSAALPRLEGMFTFAWSHGDVHFLARDRFGKVPLYVSRRGDRYAWASERKGMLGLPAAPLPPASILDLTTGHLSAWYRLAEREPSNAPV